MSPAELQALAAQGFRRVPLNRTVLADQDTPISTYRKVVQGPYAFLFESVQGGEKWGRYSIIGLPCRALYKVYGTRIEHWVDGVLADTVEAADPLAWIDQLQQSERCAPLEGMPVFHGGLVGYFGYDTVRHVEPRLAGSCPPDALGTPDILLMVSEEVLVFDNLAGTLRLIVNIDPTEAGALEAGEQRLDALTARLRGESVRLPPVALDAQDEAALALEQAARFSMQREAFEQAVERVREYVLAGDVMQVVPSQRMSVPFSAPPLNLYRALRNLNPSPYLYFLDLDDFQIVGSSPEILARLEHGEVTVRPIAGTRRRGRTEAEDRALEEELLADPKELAEHLMLIDLGRNDVGRIARIGTVELTEKMAIERYSHVMHIVSNVRGQLESGLSAIDVLRATLPAGTLSGAPKIRAMEIIDELEPVKRGVYGGAVGYISWAGDMDTAIAIRTAVIKDGELHIQAGAGVVADSVPALEWKETLNKARAVLRAAAMAQPAAGTVHSYGSDSSGGSGGSGGSAQATGHASGRGDSAA